MFEYSEIDGCEADFVEDSVLEVYGDDGFWEEDLDEFIDEGLEEDEEDDAEDIADRDYVDLLDSVWEENVCYS